MTEWSTILTRAAISFAISHLPIVISANFSQYTGSTDFMDETKAGASDVGKFISLLLSTTSIATPLILRHCHVLTNVAMYLTLAGGFLIYFSVVYFTTFFDNDTQDELNFEI